MSLDRAHPTSRMLSMISQASRDRFPLKRDKVENVITIVPTQGVFDTYLSGMQAPIKH